MCRPLLGSRNQLGPSRNIPNIRISRIKVKCAAGHTSGRRLSGRVTDVCHAEGGPVTPISACSVMNKRGRPCNPIQCMRLARLFYHFWSCAVYVTPITSKNKAVPSLDIHTGNGYIIVWENSQKTSRGYR